MAQHALSLEIPDVLTNCIFRVIDTSTYNENVPLDCPKLQITAPGFTTAIELQPGTEWPVDFGKLTQAKRQKCGAAAVDN